MKTGIKIINKLFWSVFVVVTFTTLSIGFSFRLWGLKGLVVPIIGCLIIFYLAVKIELVKKKYHIYPNMFSKYDPYSSFDLKNPNSSKNLFMAKGLIVTIISMFYFFILLIIGFLVF